MKNTETKNTANDVKKVNVELNEGEFIAWTIADSNNIIINTDDNIIFKTKKEATEYCVKEFSGCYNSKAEMMRNINITQYIFSGTTPVRSLDSEIEKNMKNTENNTANEQTNNKTYLVYQDKYTPGYNIYDPTDEYSHKPNDFDIVEQFEAEEGAEWFGYITESIHIEKEDIEDEGFEVEDLYKMSSEGLYNAVCEIHPDIEKEFADWENGGGITECDEDYKVEAYDVEDEGDRILVIMEVKYKFTVCNGEVVCERVK